MSEYVFKLPDLGEGTVEAEIVEWYVKPGDAVTEGDVIADVMTDKANVEVPAPVGGTVLRTTGEPGDLVAVGAELVAFETEQDVAPAALAPRPIEIEPGPPAPEGAEAPPPPKTAPTAARRAKVVTSPAIRRRAHEHNVDLAEVPGTGPRGRISRSDLDAYIEHGGSGATPPSTPASGPTASEDEVEEVKVIGVRRLIARRMVQSKSEIPHFAYVEEVDVTEVDALRLHLNEQHPDKTRLTLLPFVCLAVRRAVREFPQCNATFDAEAGVLKRYRSVHLGVATQTPDGLKVPVVRNLEHHDLWSLAAAIGSVADGARNNTLNTRERSGSTITVTSLGRLGGIVTTPVINYPEVAIIGVNKAVKRPVVIDDTVTVRLMMNLSSSFDHRFVDGFDAASMVQRMRLLLEHPATLFMTANAAGMPQVCE